MIDVPNQLSLEKPQASQRLTVSRLAATACLAGIAFVASSCTTPPTNSANNKCPPVCREGNGGNGGNGGGQGSGL